MRKFKFYIFPILVFCCFSCQDDEESHLPSAEERKAAAIGELKDQLTAPENGWRIQYRPTSGAGIFFMLLKFNDNGTVIIKSDVVDNEGEFIEQTIPYRIDSGLGLELIFETYGVFHYLFEKDQASFGAEFEFIFSERQDENMIFISKSDLSDRTVVVFEPANPGDEALFSLEITENLSQFAGLSPRIFGLTAPIQQVILNDKNISIFWSIDLSKRIINVDMAGVGTTIEEINANSDKVRINHVTGYAFLQGKLVLMAPISFQLNGEEITIREIALNDFSMTGASFCAINAESTPVYKGVIEGLGQVTILKSLFDSEGMDFQPMAQRPYSVNVLFIFDEKANSLFEGGIISEKFPAAVGFIFFYGFNSPDLPANALGFIVENPDGATRLLLREFEPTTTEGNKVAITLTSNFYYSTTPDPGEEQSLIEITDTIFEGGSVYAYATPQLGAGVFRLYNPCNLYEIFLVQ